LKAGNFWPTVSICGDSCQGMGKGVGDGPGTPWCLRDIDSGNELFL